MPVRKIVLGCLIGGTSLLLVFVLLTIALALLFPDDPQTSPTPTSAPYRIITPTYRLVQPTPYVRPTITAEQRVQRTAYAAARMTATASAPTLLPTATRVPPKPTAARSRSLIVMNGPIGVGFVEMFAMYAFDPMWVNWDSDPRVNGQTRSGTVASDELRIASMMWLGPDEGYEYGSISLHRPHLMPLRYPQPLFTLTVFMRLVSPGWEEGEAWLAKMVDQTRDRERDLVTWEEEKEDDRGRVFRFKTSASSQQLSLAVYRK